MTDRWKPLSPEGRRAARTLAAIAITAAFVPRALIGRDADALFDDDLAAQRALADAVAESELASAGTIDTGHTIIDAEWVLVTHQMAALGLAQVIAAHPELRARYLPALHAAEDALVDPRTLHFGERAWDEPPLALDSANGHAYLGYLALGLGAIREVDPDMPHAELHDALVRSLARRLDAAPGSALETYPGVLFPADIASVVGAIGQHARLTGADHDRTIARAIAHYRDAWTDPSSGYLAQTLHADGSRRDDARGSGTAISTYFLSFADAGYARTLSEAMLGHGHASFAGFGGVREWAHGVGGGDADSGPVVLGVSVAATGFGLASARLAHDRARFHELFRTAALFGVPVPRGEGWRFATGGSLGNALLLAMLTARAT